MNLRTFWLVLFLALALAQPLRVRAGAANVVEPGELYGVAALFADGESHVHARRVACAIEGAGVESRDGMLGHPAAAEIVSAPLYDAARTALVELRVAKADELARERFLAGLGPWIGALGCFLVWLAAHACGAGVLESVLAAAWVAVAPACVQGDEWGRLSDLGCALLLLVLGVRSTARTLRSEEPLRAILGGIGSGVFSGLLLASSPAGLVPFLAGVVAFAQWSFRSREEMRRFAARAGLLHSLVAALISRMLVLDGPWQVAPDGVFATWVEIASVLAFASAVPFLVAMLRENLSAKRLFPALVMLAAAGLIVVLLVRSVEPAGRVLAAWSQAHELRPLFARTSLVPVFVSLTPLVLLLPLGWARLVRGPREVVDVYLVALSLGALLATIVEPALAPGLVVASALLVARAATQWGATARLKRWSSVAAGAVLLAHALAGFGVEPDLALHETRVEIARGLRWMREHTPSPGPWNAPRAQPDWGVLSVPSRGAEIAWQARRPAVFSEAGVYGNLDTLPPIEKVLRWRAQTEFGMHATSARYLVVTPLDMTEVESVSRLPQPLVHSDPGTGPIAWLELARHAGDGATGSLKRVYASSRIVDSAGHALQGAGSGGPAISIWELPPPAKGEDSGPQMRPR